METDDPVETVMEGTVSWVVCPLCPGSGGMLRWRSDSRSVGGVLSVMEFQILLEVIFVSMWL